MLLSNFYLAIDCIFLHLPANFNAVNILTLFEVKIKTYKTSFWLLLLSILKIKKKSLFIQYDQKFKLQVLIYKKHNVLRVK